MKSSIFFLFYIITTLIMLIPTLIIGFYFISKHFVTTILMGNPLGAVNQNRSFVEHSTI